MATAATAKQNSNERRGEEGTGGERENQALLWHFGGF